MSRTYLLYGEFKGVYSDKVWAILDKWCGHDQIFKVAFDSADIEEEGFFYCEMGCSGGVPPEDTMNCFKDMLKKNGAKEVYLCCWSMHPDNIECEVDEKQEGI